MCLVITRKTEIQVAEEDIIVYKYGATTRYGGLEWFVSAYRSFAYQQNTVAPKINLYISGKHIEYGYHSLVFLKDAVRGADSFRESVVEFVIPKGTKYVVGMFEGSEAIVSETLIYIKKIESIKK